MKIEVNSRTDANEPAGNTPSILPKPVRMFSYLFFGSVIVICLCGWFVSNPV